MLLNIKRLEESDKRRVFEKLKTLESNSYSGKKLKRRKNTYSLRVGDYRIIYEIHKEPISKPGSRTFVRQGDKIVML